ncbi:MAG: US12 family protein [Candidatus Odinarchaeota archaeon]|nr:US12 family protein [Candidatus Odinarchaeota archaeon]
MKIETIKYKVFPMLGWLIALMTISAYTVSKALLGYFGVKYQRIAEAVLSPVGFIVIIVLYFVFFFIAYFTAKIPIVNVVTASIFSIIMGAGMFGSVFYLADLTNAQIVPEALILTSGVFVIAVIFQWITNKDLSSWAWWLFFLLLIAIGLTFAEIVVQATLFRIAVDLGVVILFIVFVVYDTSVIRNKLPDDAWMVGVLGFFLDFANILIRIIVLLIEIMGNQ